MTLPSLRFVTTMTMMHQTPSLLGRARTALARQRQRPGALGQLIAVWLWLLGSSVPVLAQPDSTGDDFWSRIFLPSIEVGYQVPNSSLIGGSLRFGTSIEYRIRNNNDFFIRLNYDTYGARYQLDARNTTTNSIAGTVQFTDILIAPGYRFGDKTFRIVVSAMPGIKLYDYPTATLDGQQILVQLDGRRIFTTSFLTAVEYYFDEKSALTLSLFQNQVWRRVDFWEDGGTAWGFSLGFITSLL